MTAATEEEKRMFGLPASTTFLVFGFPLLWVLYTLAFLYVSRNWERDTASEDARSEPS